MLFGRGEKMRSGECDAPTIRATIRSEVFAAAVFLWEEVSNPFLRPICAKVRGLVEVKDLHALPDSINDKLNE